MYLNPYKLVSDIRRLAAQSPDRAAACQYFNEAGEPQCIVGNAFALQGVTAEMMAGGNSVVVESLFEDFDITPAPPTAVMHWVNRVQRGQDTGSLWGEAVKAADYPEGD